VVGVYSPELGRAVYGNPGFGDLAAYPELSRTYRALEITLTAGGNARAAASLSYLYSSIDGNYEGYWDQTAGTNDPIGGASFVPEPAAATYSEGPLPNDRPHQIKGHASFRIGRGVAAGVTASWASGSPVSELGSTRFGSPYFVFLAPRGSIGRLRSVYDLNLRLAYDAPQLREGIATRLMMDVYHMGNPRQPVTVDQLHYLAVDGSGNQVAPNPNYLSPLAYQPAVAYRFGMEMTW
jgi:hypothetical protein